MIFSLIDGWRPRMRDTPQRKWVISSSPIESESEARMNPKRQHKIQVVFNRLIKESSIFQFFMFRKKEKEFIRLLHDSHDRLICLPPSIIFVHPYFDVPLRVYRWFSIFPSLVQYNRRGYPCPSWSSKITGNLKERIVSTMNFVDYHYCRYCFSILIPFAFLSIDVDFDWLLSDQKHNVRKGNFIVFSSFHVSFWATAKEEEKAKRRVDSFVGKRSDRQTSNLEDRLTHFRKSLFRWLGTINTWRRNISSLF